MSRESFVMPGYVYSTVYSTSFPYGIPSCIILLQRQFSAVTQLWREHALSSTNYSSPGCCISSRTSMNSSIQTYRCHRY
jgi:hypothetical protein